MAPTAKPTPTPTAKAGAARPGGEFFARPSGPNHRRYEALRGYLLASGRRRTTVPVHVPGAAAAAFRAGANLAPDGAVGVRSWEEFLAERVPSR